MYASGTLSKIFFLPQTVDKMAPSLCARLDARRTRKYKKERNIHSSVQLADVIKSYVGKIIAIIIVIGMSSAEETIDIN